MRIAALRKETEKEGLNPHEWFANVESVVAREIGQQTVHYVSNIYKYCAACKLVIEQSDQMHVNQAKP